MSYQDIDEQSLAGLCSNADTKAGDELYRRYAARLMTLCRRYSSNSDDAKDLMQETLVKALDKISSFQYRGEGSLYAWISRIAINRAVNDIRRHRWRFIPLGTRFEDMTPEPTEQDMSCIPREKLLDLISSLPAERRAVFNLYCIEGYSHKEISKMLGISEKGSAGVLAKARKQLKETINRYLKDTE